MTPEEREPFTALRHTVQQGMAAHVAEAERRWGPLPARVRAQRLARDPVATAGDMAARWRQTWVREHRCALTLPCLLYGSPSELSTAERRRAATLLPNATLVPLAGVHHPQGFQRVDLILPHVTDLLARVTQA